MSQLFNDPAATLKNELKKLKGENTALRQKLAAAMQQVKAPPTAPQASDDTTQLTKQIGNQAALVKAQEEELVKLRRELIRSRTQIDSLHKEYSDRAQTLQTERLAADSKVLEKLKLMEKKLKSREAKLEAAEAEIMKLRSTSSPTAHQPSTALIPSASNVASSSSVAEVERAHQFLSQIKESIAAYESGSPFTAVSSSPKSNIALKSAASKKANGQKRARSPQEEVPVGTPNGGSPGISTNDVAHHEEGAASSVVVSTVPVTTTATVVVPKRRGRPPKSQGAAATTTVSTPSASQIVLRKLTAEDFGVTSSVVKIGGLEIDFSGDAFSKYLNYSRQLVTAAGGSEAKALATALIAHYSGDKGALVAKIVSHIASTQSCSFRTSVTKGVRALHTLVVDISPLEVGDALLDALARAAVQVMGEESAVAIDHSEQGVAFGHTIRLLSSSLLSFANTAVNASSATAADRLNVNRLALLPTLAAYDCVVAYLHTHNHERSNPHQSHAFSQLLSFVGGLLYTKNKMDMTADRGALLLSVQYTIAEAMREWQQSASERASPKLAPQGAAANSYIPTLYQDVCEAVNWSGQVYPRGLPELLDTLLSRLNSSECSMLPVAGGTLKSAKNSQALIAGRDFGLCVEPYKQLQMATRLVILSCGFSLGYQRLLNDVVGSAPSMEGSCFRDACTVELLALMVDDFGVLDEAHNDKARLESIVGLFKDFLGGGAEESQIYCTLSAQNTLCNAILDSAVASHKGGLFTSLVGGGTFDVKALKGRIQQAVAALVI